MNSQLPFSPVSTKEKKEKGKDLAGSTPLCSYTPSPIVSSAGPALRPSKSSSWILYLYECQYSNLGFPGRAISLLI